MDGFALQDNFWVWDHGTPESGAGGIYPPGCGLQQPGMDILAAGNLLPGYGGRTDDSILRPLTSIWAYQRTSWSRQPGDVADVARVSDG